MIRRSYDISAAVSLTSVLLVLVGCGKESSESPRGPKDERVPVEVAEVRLDTLRETVRGIGTLRAAETVEIKPEVNGIIREIGFEEGGRVKKAQVLFAIDDEKLKHHLRARKAALEAARARLADAQRQFNRLRKLMKRSVATQDEFDKAQADFRAATADVERAEAEVELSKEQLDDTHIRAPFEGVISERSVDVGDYVNVGEHLATLYRVSQMEIAFTLPERFMGRVQGGQTVSVAVSAFPDRRFEGKVYFVSPHVDEVTRDFLVKAKVKNPEGLLKPGAFGTAEVTLKVREKRPVIPEESLVATRQGYIVFVVEDETAKRREVRIGLRETGTVEAREGLKAGERVVRAGQMNVSDGTPVRVVRTTKDPSDSKRPPLADADTRP